MQPTPQNIALEKLRITEIFKKFPTFLGPEV
jgi:hypothetical protein